MNWGSQGILLLGVVFGVAGCGGGNDRSDATSNTTASNGGSGGAGGLVSWGGAVPDGALQGGSSMGGNARGGTTTGDPTTGQGGADTGGRASGGTATGGAALGGNASGSLPPITIPRGRPRLNAARTTFVADNGQLLRGPYTSSEWGDPAPNDQIKRMETLGFNALHIYGECFDKNYPQPGSTAPGYSAARLDRVVQATRDNGIYLIITIGNGANNGNYNREYVTDFWKFYAQRYANDEHVIFEIQNEPVAWGPPYVTATTPSGALDMEIEAYKTIRQYAPNTPVLVFSYSVLGGTGGTDAALKDIPVFNQAVFGNPNATWTNLAVGFHGYAGAKDTAVAVSGIIKAGYPVFMTEFGGGIWGVEGGGLDVEGVANWERLGVSWLAFSFVPPWGVSDDVSKPEVYKDRVEQSGLSWVPDFGTFPVARGVYPTGGVAWTTPEHVNNGLSGVLRVEAENFDNGGKGVAYGNANTSNSGGQYRTNETVGIETTSDTGGGYAVSSIATGDYLEYTIRVPSAGTYDLRLRLSSMAAARVQVLGRGSDLTGDFALPNTGGKQAWTTVTKSVLLGSGMQRLRISAVAGGFDLNWLELAPAAIGPIADGTYRFQNAGNQQYLSVNESNTVVLGGAQEQWRLQHTGGGQYKVTRASNGNAWNTWMGPLYLTGWWGAGDHQSFLLLPVAGGSYRIVPVGSGKCLEPSAKDAPKLGEVVCSGAASQQWTIL